MTYPQLSTLRPLPGPVLNRTSDEITKDIHCLPSDVLSHILSYLSLYEVVRLSHVSTQWKKYLAQNEGFWKNICQINHKESYLKMFNTSYVQENGWYKTFKLIKGINFATHSFKGSNLNGPHKMAISMDLCASADRNGIRVYNLVSGEKLYSIKYRSDDSASINIAISGNFLIDSYSTNKSYSINIWDLKTGQSLSSLEGHTEAITAIDARDNVIVSGSKSGMIKWWDIQAKTTCTQTISVHKGYMVNSVILCDKYSISAATDGNIKIISLSTFECIKTLSNNGQSVNTLASDGTSIFSGGDDKEIKIWNLKTGEYSVLGKHEDSIQHILVQNRFLCSRDDHNITTVAGMNNDLVMSHNKAIIRLLDPNENRKAAADNVFLWDLKSKTRLKTSYRCLTHKSLAFQGEVLLIADKTALSRKSICTLYPLNGYKSLNLETSVGIIGKVKKAVKKVVKKS